MLTAEELYARLGFMPSHHTLGHDIKTAMIEFAKMHVQAALEAAAHNADMKFIPYQDDEEIDRESILNAYSLDNIK